MGPIRPQPERIFTIDRWTGLEWRQRGMGAFLDFLTNQVDADTLERLDEWLRHLQLGQEINVKRARSISGFDALCQVIVHDSTEVTFNVKDVGFGASQVLPVVLQSLLATSGTLVIIEQPELHLHPRAQTKLADLFVESLFESFSKDEKKKTQNDRKARDVCFLIETHSEHLFLRLRRWVAQSSARSGELLKNGLFLAREWLAVYFIHREHSISEAQQIRIAPNGDLKNKPKGFQDFFADDMHESVKLAKERLKVEE